MGSFLSKLVGVGDPLGIDPINQGVQKKLNGGGGGAGRSATPVTDTYGQGVVQQLSQMYPGLQSEYNHVTSQLGDKRSYEQWLSDFLAANPNNDEAKTLNNFVSTGQWVGADGTTIEQPVPLEQGLLNQALPGLIGDINQDTQRRTLAGTLGTNAINDVNQARGVLTSALGPSANWQQYFQDNPDVAAAYAQSDHSQTPAQFAQAHYDAYGKNEGRTLTYSTQLQRDNANADQTGAAMSSAANEATQKQLAALAQYTDSLKANLSGEMATRAAALSAQIKALNANLDTYDATQKADLAQQITAMGQDLEKSVNDQRTNLTTELGTLQGAVDTEGQARKAALQDELDKLNAAQAPLNQARLAAANNQATAINLGLETTKDQLTSDQAQQGYIGGSSAGDANLTRATISARQAAAQAIGNAKVANASDTRDIGVQGATQGRTIADAIAAATRDVTGQGAVGNRTLSDALATGQQQLGDYNATQGRTIGDATAAGRATIGNTGATTAYNDTLYGAGQTKTIGDQGAGGTYTLTSALAQKQNQIADQTAGQKAANYGGDYQRQLGAALTLPSLGTGLTSTLTGLDNYGTSGLNRSLNTLNWWSSGGNAPTPNFNTVTANPSGSDIAGLGTGLLGSAFNLANSKNWWQTPSTGTKTPGGPSVYSGGSSNLFNNIDTSGD